MDLGVDTLIWTLFLVVPFGVLTAAALLLWRHARSAPTALMSLGFAALFLSLVSGLFAPYITHAVFLDLMSQPPAQQDTLYLVAHYHRLPLLTLGLLGAWAAAAGTLWHVLRSR